MSGPQKTTCYAEMKERFGLTDTELAETQRIVKAYNETKKQGDAASTAFKQNAVQAAANTLVGIQALKMSQVAQQNAQNTGSLPPPVLGIAPLPNFAPTITPGSATSQDGKDFGLNGGLGDTALGNNGGAGIRGSIKGGRPMTGVNGFNAAKSTVSSAGGGSGGAGGRGGAGAGGRKSGSSRNLASSGVAGYESGGGARFGGANTQGNAPAQDTALTDAIKKLLGGDEAAGQANAVDPNRMVAGGEETYAPEAEGYGAYESDVSLFQQINAKYRQIYSNGML